LRDCKRLLEEKHTRILSAPAESVHQEFSPGRTAVLHERAYRDLTDLARQLHQAGKQPLAILLELGRLNAQLGCPFVSVLPSMHQLPGLERWTPEDVLAVVQARLNSQDQADIVAGLESPAMEERERRRRACKLSVWLWRHAGERIAEQVVCAAEFIATDHLLEEDL
jgi:hypothetical protein